MTENKELLQDSQENQEEKLSISTTTENTDEVEQKVEPQPVEDIAEEAEVKVNSSKIKDMMSLQEFQQQIENSDSIADKVELSLDYLREALTSHSGPHLKEFWEARKLVMPLYKAEELEPAIRSERWDQLDQLTREARRLRELVNEQSAFAAEQIEIAITDIEKGLENLSSEAPEIDVAGASKTLKENVDFYLPHQQELVLLNAYASRINALRKELIKTDIRIRQKNKLFKRLSAAGDKVFPRRKELIKEVSEHFVSDVENYVNSNFSNENGIKGALYILREEVKALQAAAKNLTLNTHAFNFTRKKLSECWDVIKDMDRDRKKKRLEMRETYIANADAIMEELKSFEEQYNNGDMSLSEGDQKLNVFLKNMRKVELGPEQVKQLKEKIAELRAPIAEKLHAEEEARKAKIAEQLKIRQEKEQALREQIEKFIEDAVSMEVVDIEKRRDDIVSEIRSGEFRKTEQIAFERLLSPIKDLIIEKKEEALLSLSVDDRNALENLNELLMRRKEARKEIKKQLDDHKRSKSSSSLDFEKAMYYNELINEEKCRLEKADDGIKDIQKRIKELRDKV